MDVIGADLESRVEVERRSPAYANYLRVRDEVLRMKGRAQSETGVPSEYWREELEPLQYLFDASPLVIARLREHTHWVTGIRAYDYRRGKDPARFAEKLAALLELAGEELFVPESPMLGGFGFLLDGDLVNVDTLKYFEALVALERAAVLGAFREPAERPVAWEIGTGWGGFAYQFKSLFPDATYVLVDLPELFLFSATYLLTAFPDAKVIFCTGDEPPTEEEWRTADFVFVPNTSLDLVRPPRLDLVLNMVSFQEMTAGQVEEYARAAFDLRAPFIYSLNREHSFYNDELDSVTAILDKYFWTRVVPILPVSYVKMLDAAKRSKPVKPGKGKPAKEKPGKARAGLDYKHLVGTLRVDA